MSKILVIDDSEIIRNQLVGLLNQNGYQPIEAKDGVEGLQSAKESNPDIIITDLNMPNMNGLQLIEELRKLPEFAQKHILILTTETNADLRKKGQALKVRAWINKPINEQMILQILGKLLAKKAA